MSQKTSMTFVGVLFIIAGVLALFNPAVASFTAEQVIGWMFLFAGVLQTYSAFRAADANGRIWILLGGVLAIVIGVALISKPALGMAVLTILVACLFLASGFVKVFSAFPLKETVLFWPLLISGAISVLLAIMIFSNFPMSALAVLGILLGIELLSNGLALITLAQHQDKDTDDGR